MTQHILKLPEPYFSAVESGVKTFEARRNDRAYQAGDSLLLYDSSACDCSDPFCDKRREPIVRVITFVFTGDPSLRDLGGVVPGHAVLALDATDYSKPVTLSHDEIETALRKVAGTQISMAEYDSLARSVGSALDAKQAPSDSGRADG